MKYMTILSDPEGNVVRDSAKQVWTGVTSTEKLEEVYEETYNVVLVPMPDAFVEEMANTRGKALMSIASALKDLGVPAVIVEAIKEESAYSEGVEADAVVVSAGDSKTKDLKKDPGTGDSKTKDLKKDPGTGDSDEPPKKIGDNLFEFFGKAKAALTKDVKLSEVKIKM